MLCYNKCQIIIKWKKNMSNFFKKKLKEKPKNRWQIQQEYEIAYEMAKDYINDVDGIMFRYKHWLRELGKDQTEEEKAYIAWIKEHQKELWQEERDVTLDTLERNKKIIDVYGKLRKEYFATFKKGDQAAREGLPQKYITTKVDYSEFETDKGAKDGLS